MPAPSRAVRRTPVICATLLLLLLLFVSLVLEAAQAASGEPYFVVTRYLRDGELERRLHYRGYTVKETSAVFNGGSVRENNNKNNGSGIRLLQITDGRHFVQAIYDADYRLKDCEYVRDRQTVRRFLAGFEPDRTKARKLARQQRGSGDDDVTLTHSGGNTTVFRLLDDRVQVDEDLRPLTDYTKIRSECKVLHQQIKDVAKRGSKLDSDVTRRKKRELFIYPGTNWCGVGTSSERYNELGWNAAADRCCRQHDHCPYIIDGFSTKYNLFNYRFHTLSECECDERFRTCLKMMDNGPSNLVGKLFFNVVQMKCFVLKTEKVCVKRSWWGRCLKYEKQLTAHLRDVLPY